MGREVTGVIVEGPLILLSEPQINILRHLGKGLSRNETANELNLPYREFRRTLKEVFGILEVDGEVPAVMQALKLGILDVDVDGLLEPDFDLKQYSRLGRSERVVLDLLVDSKSTKLDEEVFKGAGIETTRETSQYVTTLLWKVNDEKIGFPSRMQLLVHYFAFRNNEEFLHGQTGEQSIGNNNFNLSNQELRVIGLLAQGLPPSVVAKRCSIDQGTVDNYKNRALNKLKVEDVPEAIRTLKEMGLLKS